MERTVLVIEDEMDLADVIGYHLEKEGYKSRIAYTGHEGLEAAKINPKPDLVLLDLNLPDMSGIEVCRRLRMDSTLQDVFIIMVTAKSDEIDRVIGFEVGADDYVIKPFSSRELMLRVRAMLRRVGQTGESNKLCVGSLVIDKAAHRCWNEDQEIQLTALEFRLLRIFLENQDIVQTRETLLKEVWNMD
ncbi:MAG: response regulator transcription factor, partial [Myxococcota bacterium]|nr:response regulator transcription factor [Myxococcota bacterium]